MNHPQDGLTATPASLALRDVHRAITALRRGGPVRVNPTPDTTLVLLSAETVDHSGLAAFAEMTLGEPVLLLTSARTASLLGRTAPTGNRVETFALPVALQTPPALHSLADPTVAQLDNTAWMAQPAAPVPAAGAAIALAKLARLLPAVLVASAARPFPGAPSAQDILDYPAAASATLERVIEALVPLEDAPDARVLAFRAPGTGVEHLAIVIGQPHTREAPLVRIHSECFTGDLLGSLRCDCGPQLRAAIRRIAQDGGGVLLYLSQEGRGIGLVNKLRAYALQDRGLDTYDANGELGWGADERDYLAAATMLEQLGISRLRLLTNNPDKLAALIACGVEVVGRESHIMPPNGVNDRYIAAKVSRFGHLFTD